MQTALITGASSGLGAGLAKELAKRGYAVGLIARREGLLSELCESIALAGGTAAWRSADVTDREGLQQAMRELEAELGACDLMVANAGGGGSGPIEDFSAEQANGIMRLNYEGTVNAIEAVLPGMLERGHGQIVATSSLAAYRGVAPGGPYSAAKAAVSTLMEALSVELRPRGIAVTTVHPGFVRTPLTDKNDFSMPFLMELDDAVQAMADGIVSRRREVNFPWQMATLMRVVRWLPRWVFEPVLRRLS